MSAPAQVRRIQGRVVDEGGQPVAGATVEAAMVSLADADFAVRHNDQTWRAQTNASGDYIVAVPHAGEYVVRATKEGVGNDRTKVAVRRGGLFTANLTLWKTPAAIVAAKNCGMSSPIGAFARSPLAAGADAGLTRLLGWLEAVQRHTPGCSDVPAIEVGRWEPGDLLTLMRDVRKLVTFVQRAEDDKAILFIYNRRFTLDELQRVFFGGEMLGANALLRRGAVFHADIGMFVPGNHGRYPLVQDGGRRGWRGGSPQWTAGRQLLDSIAPAASADAGTLIWYRAVSAHLFRAGNLADLAAHLNRARQVFPQSAEVLFDSGCLHQELSSPAIQASLQELRANDVNVAVDSRTSELQRAERFFREGLVFAPADADARMRLGHVLGELGRHADAAAELRKAIAAQPDRRRLYLSELFLGREEEALGRSAEAKRRYERAAGLYPDAQSPRLALSRLARLTGDGASAHRSLLNLAAIAGVDSSDPWWAFYQPHQDDAEALLERMRRIGFTE